jgi:UDP-N-acetylglucosamine 2-epimerase (non-hydrolysing)
MKTLLTVLGTRPEITKLSPLLPELDRRFRHVIVHTGQHYDENMDRVFFRELELRAPDRFLGAGAAGIGPAAQIGRMLERLEPILAEERPDTVLVLGDTNSALAGALAAAKANVPVAHVEAGCRSFNRATPEEQNRVAIDHLATFLFAPDAEAVEHLKREGLDAKRIFEVGSTALDAIDRMRRIASRDRLKAFGVEPDAYALATVHRAENTGDPRRMHDLCDAFERIGARLPVIFPVHPRTAGALATFGLALNGGVRTCEPLGYLDFVALARDALFILSDSGGVQEEAAALNRPCLVLRDETEWTRLVDAGKNFLVGTSPDAIVATAARFVDDPAWRAEVRAKSAPLALGAAQRIAQILSQRLSP